MAPDRSRSQEQVRADVERALREVFDAATAAPTALAGRVVRCATRTTSRVIDLVPPLRLLRSALDVTLANVVTPVESSLDGGGTTMTATPPEPAAAAAPPTRVTPPVAEPAGVIGERGAAALPIEEYESLAASQVVARLPALNRSELRAVRSFEAANRGRRTVLGKIDQLLG